MLKHLFFSCFEFTRKFYKKNHNLFDYPNDQITVQKSDLFKKRGAGMIMITDYFFSSLLLYSLTERNLPKLVHVENQIQWTYVFKYPSN